MLHVALTVCLVWSCTLVIVCFDEAASSDRFVAGWFKTTKTKVVVVGLDLSGCLLRHLTEARIDPAAT